MFAHRSLRVPVLALPLCLVAVVTAAAQPVPHAAARHPAAPAFGGQPFKAAAPAFKPAAPAVKVQQTPQVRTQSLPIQRTAPAVTIPNRTTPTTTFRPKAPQQATPGSTAPRTPKGITPLPQASDAVIPSQAPKWHPGMPTAPTSPRTPTERKPPTQKGPTTVFIPVPIPLPGIAIGGSGRTGGSPTTSNPPTTTTSPRPTPIVPATDTTIFLEPAPPTASAMPHLRPERHHYSGALRAAGIWQQNTDCLPFGGTPDVNGNGIPDYIYDTATGSILLNPAEPDSDNNGWADVGAVDADGNNIPDLADWKNAVFQKMQAAGINPMADDDQDGVANAIEMLITDQDGDGIVDLNDASPCGAAANDPNGGNGIAGGVPGGGFFPIPFPMPVPMPIPGGGLVGLGPQPVPKPGSDAGPAGGVFLEEQPIERSVLVATVGDVDADSDNSNAAHEPDHSAAEETVEDDGNGLVLQASTDDDRQRAPLDVKLATVGAATRVRFRDVGAHLALYTSDPVENASARQLEFDRDYAAGDLGFTADVFRRLYLEGVGGGRDAVTVEIDADGSGAWTPVDGLLVTTQASTAAAAAAAPSATPVAAAETAPMAAKPAGWPTQPIAAPGRPELRAGDAFMLPAQGIGAQPGRVTLKFGPAGLDCPVEKWTASLLQARVTAVDLQAAADGDLVITLPDGRVAATIPVRVVPAPRSAAAEAEAQAAVAR